MVTLRANGSAIGHALRIIRAGQHPERQNIQPEDSGLSAIIKELEQHFAAIKSAGNHQDIVASTPAFPCHRDESFLEAQKAVMVALFLFEMPLEYCPAFNRHLNFCQNCAAFFAEVLRSFAPGKVKG